MGDRKSLRPNGIGRVLGTELRTLEQFHLKRVEASLILKASAGGEDQPPISVRAILNDLSEQGTAIFVPHQVSLGATGKLILPEPRALEVGIETIWCQELQQPHSVLAGQRFPFRIGLKFVFANEEDSQKFKQFCAELAQSYPGRDLLSGPFTVAA